MKRPEISLENYEEVYKYYGEHQPNKLALKGLHAALSALYHPHIQYAEGAKERTAKLLDSDYRLILASNHLHMFDQLPIGGAMHKQPLKPIVGNTTILSKPSYFENRLLRPALDACGAIPIFREKDSADRAQQMQSTHRALDTVGEKLQSGGHLIIFPEGTRNTDDPEHLAKLQAGIGHIAVQADKNHIPVGILPIGLWYGDDKNHSLFPEIYINSPIEPPFESPNQVVQALTESMADSLAQAQAISAELPADEAPN
jgi:1-acyl-sn-glycerol-3-phosphate acyltransferase